MYKLIKIMRMFKLLRLAKVAKGENSVVKKFTETMSIGIGFQRLLFILIVFFFFTHVVSCIWIMCAKFQDYEGTWMEGQPGDTMYKDMSNSDQYLAAMYFSFTTITTVGYGDILGNSSLEKVICIFIMFIGVIFFTLGSGALASILQNYDS